MENISTPPQYKSYGSLPILLLLIVLFLYKFVESQKDFLNQEAAQSSISTSSDYIQYNNIITSGTQDLMLRVANPATDKQ